MFQPIVAATDGSVNVNTEWHPWVCSLYKAGADSDFWGEIDDDYFGYYSSAAINAIKSAITKASFLNQQDKDFPREKLKNYSILSGLK
jgi:hypothetical protein